MGELIVVVGAGGFGREVLDVIQAINLASVTPPWKVVGVVDDSPSAANLERLYARGHRYLGASMEIQRAKPSDRYVVGIGAPQARARIASEFNAAGWSAAALVHPAANVGSQVAIGEGSVICGGAQISTNTRLGQHVHLNPGAIVGHDSDLDDFVSVNPGAIVSGDVRLRTGSLVGAGAVVLQGLTIGESARIGASACVTRDVIPGATVKGVPAR